MNVPDELGSAISTALHSAADDANQEARRIAAARHSDGYSDEDVAEAQEWARRMEATRDEFDALRPPGIPDPEYGSEATATPKE